MSTARIERPGEDRHAHLEPQELVEIALEQISGRVQTDAFSARAHARARECPECSRGLDAALEDLSRVRAALVGLASNDPRRAATLAEATIAVTTREDLSWRGDGRALGRFLRNGFRASLPLRVLAAILLLHLVALPVLAVVFVLQLDTQETPRVENAALVAEVLSGETERVPLRDHVSESELPEQAARLPELPTRKDRLAQARRDLLENGAPKLSAFERQLGCGEGTAESIAQLLMARSQRLELGNFDAAAAQPAALADRALCAEHLLENWASSGRVDRRLSAVVWQLPDQGLPGSNSARAEAEPAHSDVERAAAGGLELASLSGTLAPRPPIDRELFDALEQACASNLANEPVGPLAEWIAWGRGRVR